MKGFARQKAATLGHIAAQLWNIFSGFAVDARHAVVQAQKW